MFLQASAYIESANITKQVTWLRLVSRGGAGHPVHVRGPSDMHSKEHKCKEA